MRDFPGTRKLADAIGAIAFAFAMVGLFLGNASVALGLGFLGGLMLGRSQEARAQQRGGGLD